MPHRVIRRIRRGGRNDQLVQDMMEVARADSNPSSGGEARESARAARFAADLVDDAAMAQRLVESADKLDAVASKLSLGIKRKSDFEAVYGIYQAWRDLDPASIRANPQRAARKFGKLFKHAGTIAKYLPPPLDAYADFLGGFEDFFENMRDKMDPESPNTPRGRALRKVMNM